MCELYRSSCTVLTFSWLSILISVFRITEPEWVIKKNPLRNIRFSLRCSWFRAVRFYYKQWRNCHNTRAHKGRQPEKCSKLAGVPQVSLYNDIEFHWNKYYQLTENLIDETIFSNDNLQNSIYIYIYWVLQVVIAKSGFVNQMISVNWLLCFTV